MQQGLLEALELHTDYRPDCKTTISRLELGKAWPNLEIVRALATLDATLDGGGAAYSLAARDGGRYHIHVAPFDHHPTPRQMADDIPAAYSQRHRQ